jgi:hypothetical protein
MRDGLAFERDLLNEVSCFKNAESGVTADDVEAALILREADETDLLRLLHARTIHIAVPLDEDAVLADLMFEIN